MIERKTIFKKGLVKVTAFVLLCIILMLFSFPSSLNASCETAYWRCIFEALLSGFIHPAVPFAWEVFCMIGYVWCLEFME
ncbi:MAG: hypothetical protein ABIN61_08890 [candidate division WOR-3 bacterium]